MRNKMISALLATAMVASMITVPVLASEGETEAAASVDLSNVEAKEAYHFEIVSKGFQHLYLVCDIGLRVRSYKVHGNTETVSLFLCSF